MTRIDNHIRFPLLAELSKQTPAWLRSQLINPDPVWLHDWNLTKAQYEAAVRDALRLVS